MNAVRQDTRGDSSSQLALIFSQDSINIIFAFTIHNGTQT